MGVRKAVVTDRDLRFEGGIESDGAVSATTRTSSRRSVAGIQYLRGFAALMVVIYHLSLQWTKIAPGAARYLTLQSGVDVFFVISGFVMAYSTGAGAKLSALEFMRHRIVRIAPLYWTDTLATAVILLIYPTAANIVRLEPHLFLASLAFVPYFNVATRDYTPLVLVGWTLNFEMFFYVVFALAIWLGQRQPAKVMILSLSVLTLLPLAGMVGLRWYFATPMLLEFALGVLVAAGFEKCRKLPFAVAALLCCIGIIWLVVPPAGAPEDRVGRYALPALLLLVSAVQSSWPSIKWLHRLGDISYSLYLSHFLLLAVFAVAWRRLGLGSGALAHLAFFTSGGALALTCGYLCWRWLELPLTRSVRRHLSPSLRTEEIVTPHARRSRNERE